MPKDLPMVINGTEVVARHDSSAGGNFMSRELFCRLNLDLCHDANGKRHFTLGNGKTVRSIGRSYASCSFTRDPATRIGCWFDVLSKLSTSLIMGMPFLEESQTLSKYRYRLWNRTTAVGNIPTVNLIEPETYQTSKKLFVCDIDDRKTLANPDSASDLDLVSPEYASTHGYKVMEHRRQIQLADTSNALTSGKILATLGLTDGRKFLKFFDVLPGLGSDILLGEDTLESIEAFTRLSGSFVDAALDTKTPSELKIIIDCGNVHRLLFGSGDPAVDKSNTQN